jgi:uncharacterized protein (AIM24 family)
MPVHDELLGSTQPVLSISLEPGESVVAETAEFAWMTDSIQMAAGPAGLSAYTAKDLAGTIAFASRLPGSIVCLEITTEQEYLVHRRGFLAGTPGIEVSTGFQQQLGTASASANEFILRRIGGCGRAWVELAGDVVQRELTAGTSLRTHPWHIGICHASVAVQMAQLAESATSQFGNDTQHFAVLSGPGSVWLQSMALLTAPFSSLASDAASGVPAAEGAAGPTSHHHHIKIEVRDT